MDLIEVPENYEFLRNWVSTVSFEGQTARIAMATELMEALTNFDSTSDLLLDMYSNLDNNNDAYPFMDPSLNQSTKSIKSKVAASQDFFASNSVESAQIKTTIEAWISAQVLEVFPSKNKLAQAGVAGQIADGSTARYINSIGLEYDQLINKALIGALIVDQMLNNYLGTAVLDEAENINHNNDEILVDGTSYTNMEHKWDEAYGYLFGAAGTSFSDPISSLGEDSFLNKYLARVDSDSDFNGIANDIYEAFKLGRAAIVAQDYDLRDEQVEIIREHVSKVIAIRAVYYLQQGKIQLINNKLGAAFHELSEGFGFIYSLRFTRQADSNETYFNREEVDSFMQLLTEGNGFWDIETETLDLISDQIAAKFDFTVEQAAN